MKIETLETRRHLSASVQETSSEPADMAVPVAQSAPRYSAISTRAFSLTIISVPGIEPIAVAPALAELLRSLPPEVLPILMSGLTRIDWSSQLDEPVEQPPAEETESGDGEVVAPPQEEPGAVAQESAADETVLVAIPQDVDAQLPEPIPTRAAARAVEVDVIGERSRDSRESARPSVQLEAAAGPFSVVAKALSDDRYGPVAGSDVQATTPTALQAAAQPRLSGESADVPTSAQVTAARITPDFARATAAAPSASIRAAIIREVNDRGGHRNIIAAVMAGATVIAANWLRRRRRQLATISSAWVDRERN